MIALVLGLLVTGAAAGVFLANKRVYAASETLNRVQENSRVSFELMSRDVREAGGSPCGGDSEMVNMLAVGAGTWWERFGEGLRGFDGGNTAGSGTAPVTGAVPGTDAIDLYSSTITGGDYVITDQDTPSAVVGVTSPSDPTLSNLADGDIVIACNTKYTLVFQVTNVNTSSLKLGHQGGNGSPGNCGQNFQFVQPGNNCSGASGGNTYCFTRPNSGSASSCDRSDDMPATLTKAGGVRWYIGNNGRGSRSLYRATFDTNGTGSAPTVAFTEEIAEGVTDLQLQYRIVGSTTYIAASAVSDWKQVNAVRIRIVVGGAAGALSGADIRGTDNQTLSREFIHVVALRNREGVL